MKYYVYIYLDPRKKGNFVYKNIDLSFLYEPFYVGKGIANRIETHMKSVDKNSREWEKNKYKSQIIYDIINEGLDPIRFKIKFFKTKKQQSAYEYLLINNIGRKIYNHGPLTNILPGKHSDNPGERRKGKTLEQIFGKKKAQQWKSNMAKSHDVSKNPGKKRKGKKLEDLFDKNKAKNWKTKISKANKGKKNPMFGISMLQRMINKYGQELGNIKYLSWRENTKRAKRLSRPQE